MSNYLVLIVPEVIGALDFMFCLVILGVRELDPFCSIRPFEPGNIPHTERSRNVIVRFASKADGCRVLTVGFYNAYQSLENSIFSVSSIDGTFFAIM